MVRTKRMARRNAGRSMTKYRGSRKGKRGRSFISAVKKWNVKRSYRKKVPVSLKRNIRKVVRAMAESKQHVASTQGIGPAARVAGNELYTVLPGPKLWRDNKEILRPTVPHPYDYGWIPIAPYIVKGDGASAREGAEVSMVKHQVRVHFNLNLESLPYLDLTVRCSVVFVKNVRSMKDAYTLTGPRSTGIGAPICGQGGVRLPDGMKDMDEASQSMMKPDYTYNEGRAYGANGQWDQIRKPFNSKHVTTVYDHSFVLKKQTGQGTTGGSLGGGQNNTHKNIVINLPCPKKLHFTSGVTGDEAAFFDDAPNNDRELLNYPDKYMPFLIVSYTDNTCVPGNFTAVAPEDLEEPPLVGEGLVDPIEGLPSYTPLKFQWEMFTLYKDM